MTEEALPSASMGLTRRVRLARTMRRGRKGRLGLKTRRGRKGRCGRRCRAWRAASCGTSGAARRNRALLNVVLHRWLRPVHVEVRKLYAERLADLLSIDRPLSHFLILSSSTYLDRISPLLLVAAARLGPQRAKPSRQLTLRLDDVRRSRLILLLPTETEVEKTDEEAALSDDSDNSDDSYGSIESWPGMRERRWRRVRWDL